MQTAQQPASLFPTSLLPTQPVVDPQLRQKTCRRRHIIPNTLGKPSPNPHPTASCREKEGRKSKKRYITMGVFPQCQTLLPDVIEQETM